VTDHIIKNESPQFFEIFEHKQPNQAECQQSGEHKCFEMVEAEVTDCLDSALALHGEQGLPELVAAEFIPGGLV